MPKKQTTFGSIAEGVVFSFVGDQVDCIKTSESDCYDFFTNSFRCVSEKAEVVLVGSSRLCIHAAIRHHIGVLSILQRYMA